MNSIIEKILPAAGSPPWLTVTVALAWVLLAVVIAWFVVLWFFFVPLWIWKIRRASLRTAAAAERTADAMERVIKRAAGTPMPAKKPASPSAMPAPRKPTEPEPAAASGNSAGPVDPDDVIRALEQLH